MHYTLENEANTQNWILGVFAGSTVVHVVALILYCFDLAQPVELPQ